MKNLADDILQRAGTSDRYIVAIAGPPGAGKSTLAESLKHQIDDLAPQSGAIVVPMDGFHLDNSILDQLGLRHRKGAPETFDAAGFISLVRKIREAKSEVPVPGFDREIDAVTAGHIVVDNQNRIVLIEGNYLLLNEHPWLDLESEYDLSVFINPGIEELERRLVSRWLGYGHTLEEARTRAMSNDIPNARFVLANSRKADITI